MSADARGRWRAAARTRRHALRRDLASVARYGRHAPLWCQRIWVDPVAVRDVVPGYAHDVSGTVVPGDWDLRAAPLDTVPQFAFCRAHWEGGVPWEETGVYEFLERLMAEQGGVIDRCHSREDLVRRHAELDRIFERVRAEGRLRTRTELSASAFRERGGVYVHIGRDGRPIFGRKGNHRLAMARILRLPVVPAQLGMVHPEVRAVWRRSFGAPITGT